MTKEEFKECVEIITTNLIKTALAQQSGPVELKKVHEDAVKLIVSYWPDDRGFTYTPSVFKVDSLKPGKVTCTTTRDIKPGEDSLSYTNPLNPLYEESR